MEKLKVIYTKANKKHLGLLLFVQSLILITVSIYAVTGSNNQSLRASAEESSFSQEATNDAKTCMMLDPEERPACAKIAGIKIADQTTDPKERYKECLKFRPYYVQDCQLGLSQSESPNSQ